MTDTDRKLLIELADAVSAFGERDVDTSDIAIWFACETDDIVAALKRATSEEKEEAREERRRSQEWRIRDLEDRLDASENLTRKVASVWKLWLNDAEHGSINQGTFDSMKTLLGLSE